MSNPSGLCQCGCGKKTRLAPKTIEKLGWTKGEPIRFVHNHHGRVKPRTVDLTGAWKVDHKTGCWIWQRHIASGGYGKCEAKGHGQYAHRYVYTIYRGPIPPDMELDHLCRRRSCVNPDHLEPVTHAENGRRGMNAKLTAEKAAAIRGLLDAGWLGVDIAAAFEVSATVISRIKLGRGWVT